MLTILLFSSVLFAQVVTPPPQITVRSEVTVQAPPPDAKAISEASVTSYQAVVVSLIAPTLVSWANDLLNVPDFIRQTPADLTYGNGGVRSLAQTVQLAAGSLIALALFGFGIAYTLGQHPSPGRFVYGVVQSIGSMIFWTIGIDLNNALNNTIAAPELASLVKPHLSLPQLTQDPIAAFGPAILVIVYAIVVLLLLLSLAFRLGLIDILIALGPLALLCAATEESDHFAQMYKRLALGTLFSQVLIVVALRLAPIIGGIGSGVVSTLLGIIVLILARSMPKLLTSDRGGSSAGRFAAGLIVRRLVARH